MSRLLKLYVRDGCHLCEDMMLELNLRKDKMGFELETIEISEQPELESQYGAKVPVLLCDGQEVCHYFLDEIALNQCFGGD